MGFRTVVLLENDFSDVWSRDTSLGSNIAHCAVTKEPMRYGRILECVHADIQTLAVIDSYTMTTLANGNWRSGETADDINVKLLRAAADKLGFKLVLKE